MKINNVGMTGINPYNLQANKAGNVKESKVNASDKVEISSAAKEMQQLSPIPAARQAKVDELKIQVENGNYKLNSQATAKGLIDFYRK
ncbi:flagellar biosynthesis anti-sigma factor FlgM [Peribacillus butanolivorans]|uniref:Negative regulator of flagellin synthesis n=1 Tax=Peribacillus butanolivorans TaxID=421767 RepID=A0AAX0S0H1_9BACI|nr:flagellar biosynthesis anti-sigma factor FlgM [Peribacillus butanolivorans]AXN38763.1 flagellar biosynthesis anti-sigma factor FlgM [Peribacillus butanolivorans]MED3689459.1 flagellar biosynthesis anti-sigma factor FlgM [Peribacillus butanolivorans]PEJ30235.1 flagellar biosynthesis anti-sigma factor FlgM [Peribacillus butanolivorans]